MCLSARHFLTTAWRTDAEDELMMECSRQVCAGWTDGQTGGPRGYVCVFVDPHNTER